MSRRQTLSEGEGGGGGLRGGRRPGRFLLAALAGLVLVVLFWVGAVVVLGGNPEPDSPDASARQPANAPDTGGDVGRTVPEEATDERAVSGGDPDSAEPTPQEQNPASIEPDPDLPEGGSASEPGRYDPLGTGAASGHLSPTERGRAEQAAANYVLYAFGYTGEDQSEYTSAVNLTVVSPEFHRTPGGKSVAFFSEQVADGGTESTAALEGFEVTEESLEEVTATATFNMEGAVREGRFTQELTLVKWGAGWRVRSAGELTEA